MSTILFPMAREVHTYSQTMETTLASDDQRIFELAAIEGDRVRIRNLLKAGVDVNVVDESGNTPLFWACIYGRLETVKLLLSKHADVNAVDSRQNTPLIMAAKFGHPRVVEALLQSGAKTEMRNIDGENAGMIARRKMADDIVSEDHAEVLAVIDRYNQNHQKRRVFFSKDVPASHRSR